MKFYTGNWIREEDNAEIKCSPWNLASEKYLQCEWPNGFVETYVLDGKTITLNDDGEIKPDFGDKRGIASVDDEEINWVICNKQKKWFKGSKQGEMGNSN